MPSVYYTKTIQSGEVDANKPEGKEYLHVD